MRNKCDHRVTTQILRLMDFKEIEDLRKATGTLPSERPMKNTNVLQLPVALKVTLEDHSANPYKAMFVTATSTWGDNNFEQKWPITSPEGKLEVIKAVLTHNTLPQAKEMVQFVFRVKGVPRWLFDYHATTVKFASFMSIGCRDNNKIDSDVITMHQVGSAEMAVFRELKDLYELALGSDQASWQSARTFLPQSYSHSYHFGQNLLSLISTRGFHASKFFGNDFKEEAMQYLYHTIVKEVKQHFPLLGLYLNMMFSHEVKKTVMDQLHKLKLEDLNEKDIELLNRI